MSEINKASIAIEKKRVKFIAQETLAKIMACRQKAKKQYEQNKKDYIGELRKTFWNRTFRKHWTDQEIFDNDQINQMIGFGFEEFYQSKWGWEKQEKFCKNIINLAENCDGEFVYLTDEGFRYISLT